MGPFLISRFTKKEKSSSSTSILLNILKNQLLALLLRARKCLYSISVISVQGLQEWKTERQTETKAKRNRRGLTDQKEDKPTENRGQRLNSHFIKEDMQMANKHENRHDIIVTRKMYKLKNKIATHSPVQLKFLKDWWCQVLVRIQSHLSFPDSGRDVSWYNCLEDW